MNPNAGEFKGTIKNRVSAGFNWCQRDESNVRPTDYESVALPTELHQRRSVF